MGHGLSTCCGAVVFQCLSWFIHIASPMSAAFIFQKHQPCNHWHILALHGMQVWVQDLWLHVRVITNHPQETAYVFLKYFGWPGTGQVQSIYW